MLTEYLYPALNYRREDSIHNMKHVNIMFPFLVEIPFSAQMSTQILNIILSIFNDLATVIKNMGQFQQNV